jgi:predicted TIM-barrel fold metal-dependent hydrolase
MKVSLVVLGLVLAPLSTAAQQPAARPPIIDVHLHALPANANGPPPQDMCFGGEFVPADPRVGVKKLFACTNPVKSPVTDGELMQATLRELDRYNIIAVTSGPAPIVDRWKAASPDRIIPGWFGGLTDVSADALRKLFRDGKFAVLGEVTTQYGGVSPDDSVLEPYFALAEELDIPVGIHMGLGPPGAPYLGTPNYRARLSNPLLIEDVLVRHPKLRVYVMHAGWPMLDEIIHLLYTHPQVHVDVGVIDYVLPRQEFHHYLRRIAEAGFASRVMFGSDQMNWPQAIGYAIDSIESAAFLTAQQKRDILYNNAARFLRLSDAEMARHHGR